MSRYHKVVPSVDSGGYPLNPVRGEFSVVRPKEGVNYVTNPNMDINWSSGDIEGYYGSGLNVPLTGASYLYQMFGISSYKVTQGVSSPLTGGLGQSIDLPVGKSVVFSMYALAPIGSFYKLGYTQGAYYKIKGFYGKGEWERIGVSFVNTSFSVSFALILTQLNQTIYMDGWQVELFDTDDYDKNATTFIQNKVRLLSDYTGGYTVNLQDLGLIITGHQGLGMPEVSNTTTFLGLFDGSVFQNIKYQERKFSIDGKILANSVTHLAKIKRDLLDLLSPIRTGQRSLIRLVYQRRDDRGNSIGYKRYIDCSYVSGLEGKSIGSSEDLTISFVAPDPFFSEEKDNAVKIASSGVTQTITNQGNAPTYPIFKIYATVQIVLTSISNISVGKTVTFDSTPIIGEVVIDTQKGSFELNGVSYPGKFLSGSLRELAMTGGINLMSAVFSGGDVFIQWKNRWMGLD